MSTLRELMWPYYWKNTPLAKSCLTTMSALSCSLLTPSHFPSWRQQGLSRGSTQSRTGAHFLSPCCDIGHLVAGPTSARREPTAVLCLRSLAGEDRRGEQRRRPGLGRVFSCLSPTQQGKPCSERLVTVGCPALFTLATSKRLHGMCFR